MKSILKCIVASPLLFLSIVSCRKGATQLASEEASLASVKATATTNEFPSCCRVSVNYTGGGMSITIGNNTYNYAANIFDTSRLPPNGSGERCLVRCEQDEPPQFEWLKRANFEITDLYLERDKVTPRTCPPYGSTCLWTREQIMYSSGGTLGYDTKSIGVALDDLTTINDIMPRIEAEDPLTLMMILEKLKCRFFRKYSGDNPETAFYLAEEGNFVIAIYVDAAGETDDGFGNPLPNYSRAAVLQPGWNNRDYITWGQAATSLVRPFYGIGDYYATEDFYSAGPPSKYFFYVYTPDLCSTAGYSCD